MTDLRPAPYPADTRAKGWRFELDYEAIEQSDTWPLAAELPMCQHALLMMWMVAWAQTPCGSLPGDESVIRAKCRIPPSIWGRCRNVLMRGWWLADDGRLYHATLTRRVGEMTRRRRSDADRQAANRAREPAVSHKPLSESRVTPPEVLPESSTDNRQPITNKVKVKTQTARKRAAAAQVVSVESMAAEGVDPQHATDWLVARKAKGLPLTPTAWAETKAEAVKAGMPVSEAIKTAAGNGWAGFRASWLSPDKRGPPRRGDSKQGALEARNAAAIAKILEADHAAQ